MRTTLIFILLTLSSTLYSQHTFTSYQHEISTGRRLYYFPEWKLNVPLTTTATNGMLGWLNSFNYRLHFRDKNFIKITFNHYSGGYLYDDQKTIFDPPHGQRNTMFFKTYECFFGKKFITSQSNRHTLAGAIGLGLRKGEGFTILGTHPHSSFEPIIETFSLDSFGLPYSIGYSWYPIKYVGININLGGSFFLPRKTTYNYRDFEVSSPNWLGYLELHLSFKI